MLDKISNTILKNRFPELISILSIIVSAILIIKTEDFIFAALPIPVALGLIALYRFHWLYYLLIFCLPFSINYRFESINLNILFPTELFVALFALVFGSMIFFTKINQKEWFSRDPFTIFTLLYIVAILFSIPFSTMVLVSLKAALVSIAYIVVFYFFTSWFIRDFSVEKFATILLFVVAGFAVVSIWASVRHFDFGFARNMAAIVPRPFFSDHTIYGASMSFVFLSSWVIYRKYHLFGIGSIHRLWILVCFLLLALAVFGAHSRASWMSVAVALGFVFLLEIRIKFKTIAILLLLAGLMSILFMDKIEPYFSRNKNDSNERNSNIKQQLMSVTNISSDVSNLERLNRWSCAYRMFLDKPLTGFGHGTYQFTYLPYQKWQEMTVISVTTPHENFTFGKGGTAHSEYFLALSEIGILGGLVWLGLFLSFVYLAIRIQHDDAFHSKEKMLIILLSGGLSTYFVHAVFNNFLTTDKTAFLFWTFLAIFKVIYMRVLKRKTETMP